MVVVGKHLDILVYRRLGGKSPLNCYSLYFLLPFQREPRKGGPSLDCAVGRIDTRTM